MSAENFIMSIKYHLKINAIRNMLLSIQKPSKENTQNNYLKQQV